MDGFRPTLGNSGAVLGPSRADADGREPHVHGERGGGVMWGCMSGKVTKE